MVCGLLANLFVAGEWRSYRVLVSVANRQAGTLVEYPTLLEHRRTSVLPELRGSSELLFFYRESLGRLWNLLDDRLTQLGEQLTDTFCRGWPDTGWDKVTDTVSVWLLLETTILRLLSFMLQEASMVS